MAGYLDARPRVGYFYIEQKGNELIAEKVNKLTVKQYQSRPVVVNEPSSVYDAICKIFLEDVGTLFVVDENSTLVGIVSRKDLLRASMGKQKLDAIPISIIMTRMPNINICFEDDLLSNVAKKLIKKQIDSLPVVKADSDNKYKVVGRITKTNITKAFVELGDNEI